MRFAAMWLALALAGGAFSQTRLNSLEPGRSLQPSRQNELVAEALLRNPEILAAQKKYEAARLRPAQERSLPDPMISAGWNANGNPLPGAGIGAEPTSNIGAMVSQQLPAAGKLRLKGAVASREADAEAQQFRAVQLSVISRVKQAFHRLHHAYEILGLLERNGDSLRMLLRATEARYSVGKAIQADVFRIQTQITLVETRIAQTGRDRRAREAEINSLLSRAPRTPVGEPEDIATTPLRLTLDELVAKARDAAPMLARDQKMVERADTAVRLARRDYRPDFTVNGGYYYMGSMPPMYMFRVDMNVPLRLGRIRAQVAERSSQLAESRHTLEANARSLEFKIEDEYLAAETAQKLADLYSRTVMPQARLAVESSLASYQTGGADLTSVLGNQIAIFEYEMNYHEQLAEFQIALARLEEMTGVELFNAVGATK